MESQSNTQQKLQKGSIATGGPLNLLNETMHCNAIKRSVAVMQLVQHHKPTSSDQLETLISQHTKRICNICGQRSKGTVYDFGQNLYNAQYGCQGFLDNNPEFSFADCYQFMYNLFCVAPIRGIIMEDTSKSDLLHILNQTGSDDYKTRNATDQEDRTYAVDYIVLKKQADGSYKEILGIQVKPTSFWKQKDSVKINDDKHVTFTQETGIGVLYHSYDNKSLKFVQSDKLARSVVGLMQNTIKNK